MTFNLDILFDCNADVYNSLLMVIVMKSKTKQFLTSVNPLMIQPPGDGCWRPGAQGRAGVGLGSSCQKGSLLLTD